MYNTIGIAERIFEIWDVEEEKNDGTICEKTSEEPVRFEQIDFGYNAENRVLSDIYSRAIKFAKSRCIAPIRYAIIRAYLMGGKSYGKY